MHQTLEKTTDPIQRGKANLHANDMYLAIVENNNWQDFPTLKDSER